jgi:Uma2 family endonuclease
MSSAVKILPHYTYEDWLHWDGQWELIYGIPYAISPMPVPEHQRIGGNLFTEFRQALRSCRNSCKAYQPIDYKVSEETILQPDMLVVCDEITKKFLDFSPTLVAEILSPSTALKDRHTKFEIYQSQQVKYYLLINCEMQEVEVYQLQDKVLLLKNQGKDIQFDFTFEDCNVLIEFGRIWE